MQRLIYIVLLRFFQWESRKFPKVILWRCSKGWFIGRMSTSKNIVSFFHKVPPNFLFPIPIHNCSTSWCPSHSCRNVRIPLESTGIHWNGTGIHRNPLEWNWIPQELLYSCRNRTGIRRNGIYWMKLLIYIYFLIFTK